MTGCDDVQMTAGSDAFVHEYLSTACFHGLCGPACRQTCKFCDAPCSHSCHREGGAPGPQPWVDQARSVARELLRLTLNGRVIPPDMLYRIESEPDLFWLRGEVQPPAGEWREPGGGDGTLM